jgi:hypothetical protein
MITTPRKSNVWGLLVLLLLMGICLISPAGAVYIHSYSLSIDFGGAIDLSQFSDEIVDSPSITAVFLTALETGDDIDIHFDVTLSGPEITALDALVAAHVPYTTEQKVCRPLADADTNMTLRQISVPVLVANITAPRTYRYPTAATMVAAGVVGGDLSIINTGTATATVTVQTGGSMHGSTAVAAGTSGSFRYSVTDTTPASEVYMLLRMA